MGRGNRQELQLKRSATVPVVLPPTGGAPAAAAAVASAEDGGGGMECVSGEPSVGGGWGGGESGPKPRASDVLGLGWTLSLMVMPCVCGLSICVCLKAADCAIRRQGDDECVLQHSL